LVVGALTTAQISPALAIVPIRVAPVKVSSWMVMYWLPSLLAVMLSR
jgi:hypothetical protein